MTVDPTTPGSSASAVSRALFIRVAELAVEAWGARTGKRTVEYDDDAEVYSDGAQDAFNHAFDVAERTLAPGADAWNVADFAAAIGVEPARLRELLGALADGH